MPRLFWLGTSKRPGGNACPVPSLLCLREGLWGHSEARLCLSPPPRPAETAFSAESRSRHQTLSRSSPSPAPFLPSPLLVLPNHGTSGGDRSAVPVAHRPVWPHRWGTLRPGPPGRVWLMPFGDPAAHIRISASPSLLTPAARGRVRTEPESSRARSSEGSRPKKPRSLTTTDHSQGSPSRRRQPAMSCSPGSRIPELGLNFGNQAELFCPFAFFFF